MLVRGADATAIAAGVRPTARPYDFGVDPLTRRVVSAAKDLHSLRDAAVRLPVGYRESKIEHLPRCPARSWCLSWS